jgi:hypothetical protein
MVCTSSCGGPEVRVSERRPLVLTGLFRELQRPEGPPERSLVVNLGPLAL